MRTALVGPRSLSGSPARRAQGGNFDPRAIPGCVLWLDADYGITLNGANVSAWLDQSVTGANLVQATAANQPALTTDAVNGHSVVDANDNTDRLRDASLPDLSSKAGFTHFAVFKATSATTNQLTAQTVNSPWTFVQIFTSELYHYVTAGNSGRYAFTDTASYHIAEGWFDGSGAANADRLKAYLDGTAKTLTFGGTIPATTGAGTSGYVAGAETVSLSFLGPVAAHLLYDRALNATERALVGKYLSTRYALTTTY